ncbi:protein CASC3 [Vanacampus margaritifer]
MADRRRRRRRASQDSDDDDDESASGSESRESGSQTSKSRGSREPEPVETASDRVEAKKEVQSECESEDGVGEAVLSDYDSADPEENASHSEGAEEEEDGDGYSDEEAPVAATGQSDLVATAETAPGEDDEDVEERSKEEKESEEKGKLAGERQSGDGQESTVDPETKAGGQSEQQLDDDEDRKNPAYIPRKGLFFEHDVRGHTQEEERPKGRNRKLWKDEGRWEHDKFREEEQAPKSREELIASYGYNIRNGERTFTHRRPRSSMSPNREQRWREGGERAQRSWQSNRGGRGGGFSTRGGPHHHAPPASVPLASGQRGNAYRSRPHHFPSQQPQYGGSESHAPQIHARERAGPKAPTESPAERGLSGRGGRSGGGRLTEDPPLSKEDRLSNAAPSVQHAPYRSTSPRRQPPEQRGGTSPTQPPHASAAPRETSPPAERPVERKSYSLARRSRSRPAELGGKQTSVEEAGVGVKNPAGSGAGGGVAELEQDVAQLNLVSRQSWNQNPASYVHSEIRGLSGGLHVPAGAPAFSGLDELSGSSNRAKRYSSQRQRGVAEAAPLHMGVMEGHYYEPITYQGPIYTHGDGSAPIAPQGMLVQPEMHIPHPGLHPHQSGAPIANPALYGPLSPGQPQQLLPPPPPPFYPPQGVMTFSYPTMYPSPQGQSQVTYGGVTYYDTMQQQAQPKPSPPRRTSQPVTVKPPPPEVPFASE